MYFTLEREGVSGRCPQGIRGVIGRSLEVSQAELQNVAVMADMADDSTTTKKFLMVRFSEKICKNILGPNFFDPSVPGLRIF